MALCRECSPAVQEVPGSIPDCDALIASRSGPSLLSSGCSPTLYAEDVGGPGQPLQQNFTPSGPPQPPGAAQPPAHPLCPCSPRWCAASPIADVRRALPGSGEVITFFQNPGGNEARYRLYSSPKALQVADRCAACRSPSPRPATHAPSRRLTFS
jgi:hypothetical protein